MQALGEELKTKRATGSAGGGLVEVEVNGLGEVLAVRIDPTLVEKQDREMIEDLLPAAFNAAAAKGEAAARRGDAIAHRRDAAAGPARRSVAVHRHSARRRQQADRDVDRRVTRTPLAFSADALLAADSSRRLKSQGTNAANRSRAREFLDATACFRELELKVAI